jgi:hypothetical protein
MSGVFATDFDLLIKRGLLLLSFSIPSHCPFSSNILFKYNLYNEIHYLFTGPVLGTTTVAWYILHFGLMIVKVNFFLLYKR